MKRTTLALFALVASCESTGYLSNVFAYGHIDETEVAFHAYRRSCDAASGNRRLELISSAQAVKDTYEGGAPAAVEAAPAELVNILDLSIDGALLVPDAPTLLPLSDTSWGGLAFVVRRDAESSPVTLFQSGAGAQGWAIVRRIGCIGSDEPLLFIDGALVDAGGDLHTVRASIGHDAQWPWPIGIFLGP